MAILDRLATLKVRDVMSREIVAVSLHEEMASAATKLVAAHVSGAPVTDEQGRCVGILSAGDYIKRDVELKAEDDACRQEVAWELSAGDPNNPLRAEPANPEMVEANMSSAVQSISDDASLLTAAQQMCQGHIHRLPVLDEGSRPVGMISSLDIVAAVLGALDESGLGEN